MVFDEYLNPLFYITAMVTDNLNRAPDSMRQILPCLPDDLSGEMFRHLHLQYLHIPMPQRQSFPGADTGLFQAAVK